MTRTIARKAWRYVGVVLFWFFWPLLIIYLGRSERTRLLIVCGDEVLLVRPWLGTDHWALPGGGLHADESPLQGVIREVQEETSIHLQPSDIQPLFSAPYKFRGFRYFGHYFVAVLPKKPPLKKQRFEVAEASWINYKKLTPKNAHPDTLTTVAAWFEP